jgi:hypothetical protein
MFFFIYFLIHACNLKVMAYVLTFVNTKTPYIVQRDDVN